MEDLLVLDFRVKSLIHDYKVNFIDNSEDVLEAILKPGDVIIMDKKIKVLYPRISHVVSNNNLLIDIEAVENQKSYKGLIPIINKLISSGFRKNHRLIGIGGGITQDITAFISSIMYRGVDWILMPTTLLAQGDSCIGSKTSINFGNYKNQVGGFYPPNEIFIDMNFLNSLSEKDMKSGFGEMSHYFIVAGEKDFKQYVNDYDRALKDDKVLSQMISNSLKIKKSYIETDEFDNGRRQIFNYGHSFGHAIETLTNYEIPHGIAVSFGMDMANYVSVKRGVLSIKVRMEIRAFLSRIWKGFAIKNLDVDRFCKILSKDKKNVGKELRLILCRGYGEVYKAAVENDQQFRNLILDYFKNEL